MRLSDFNAVMVNTSGGKDSQTSMRAIARMAKEEKYPTSRIIAAHAAFPEEWPGAMQLAERHSAHYGITFQVEGYRNKDGESKTLLDYVRLRQKWPSSAVRYCTSEFKRAPCGRVLTAIHRRFANGGRTKILNIFGFRAEESPSRAKRKPLAKNTRYSTKSREVWDWLPIHEWKEQEVWDDIEASGVSHHRAYDLGMPRLSCPFCIFAPRAALMTAGKEFPELLDQYVAVENETGHKFRQNLAIADIRQALRDGEEIDAANLNGNWNM